MFRYKALATDFFIHNRRRFIERLEPGAAAVLFANPELPTNADGEYPFTQNSNFYYLSGLDQEQCALFLFPDAPRPELREVLFIREATPEVQTWIGWKYSRAEATEASGVKKVQYIQELEGFLLTILEHVNGGVYLDFNEHPRATHFIETPAHRLAHWLRERFPAHSLRRANPILAELRLIKQPEEIVQLQRAIDITAGAFNRVLRFVEPGRMEYEVEAEILHEFIRNGATGPAYSSIIAGGKNACVLHYINNCQALCDGDVLLMDFGAEYGHYSADLTRCVPVNGRFTPRQRAVYDAVLRVHRYAASILKPGVDLGDPFSGYSGEVGKMIESELIALGLLTAEEVKDQDPEKPLFRKYYPHGVSHALGLDTHDVGKRYLTVKPGMVFTIEPGIYIKEEGLGIRIENNFLVTEHGLVDLMAHIPIEADEIEAHMAVR